MDPIPSSKQREALRIAEATLQITSYIVLYGDDTLQLAVRILESEMDHLDPTEKMVYLAVRTLLLDRLGDLGE